MDPDRLGHSGLRVPALGFGIAIFGGSNDFFRAWGSTDADGGSRLIDVCVDHGGSLFDSADIYSDGMAKQILGEAIKGKRNRLLISTKTTFPMGTGPNDFGSSRQHLLDAVDGSLTRLGVDHIDLLQLHGQDYNTPVEETLATLATLDQLVGNIMAGVLTGIMLARAMALFIAGSFGWRAVFWTSAVLVSALAILLMLLIPNYRPARGMRYDRIIVSMMTLVPRMPALCWRSAYAALMFGAFNMFWTAVPLMLAGLRYRSCIGEMGLQFISGPRYAFQPLRCRFVSRVECFDR